MKILVVGATGATGRLLTSELLNRGHSVKAIVRSPENLPEFIRNHDRLSLIQASILEIDDAKIAEYVSDCSAVASCLGHNLNVQGIFSHPRKLVTEATQKLCKAVQSQQAEQPTQFVLMNTAGNSNRDLQEKISGAESVSIKALRLLVPPQSDNEDAADYLRTQIKRETGQLEWVVVRPDTLVNAEEASEYELHASPIRSALFNPGKTSRSNVAHFMAKLMTDEETWQKWRWQMPVIYNREAK